MPCRYLRPSVRDRHRQRGGERRGEERENYISREWRKRERRITVELSYDLS